MAIGNLMLRCALLAAAIVLYSQPWVRAADDPLALTKQTYDIRELTADWPGDDRAHEKPSPKDRANELAKLLQEQIDPPAWADVGGRGSVVADAEKLVVSQWEENHQRIAQLLAALRRATAAERQGRKEPAVAVEWAEPVSDKLKAALAAPTVFATEKRSLAEVFAGLSQRSGVPISHDKPALIAADVALDKPHDRTFRTTRIPLAAALALLCEGHDLEWRCLGDGLQITSREEAGHHLPLRVYPVRDLCRYGFRDDQRQLTGKWAEAGDGLIDTITTIVNPTSWDNNGGSNSSRYFRGALVIAASPDVHDATERLLTALRTARNDLQRNRNGFSRTSLPVATPGELQVKAALDRPAKLAAGEYTLEDLADKLSGACEIEVLVDRQELPAAGPVKLRLKWNPEGKSLLGALNDAFAEHHFNWCIGDGYLFLSSSESPRWSTRLFPVADLTRTEIPTGVESESEDFDTLTELATRFVDVTTWQDVGGFGAIEGFPGGVLVVQQSENAQRGVERLFTGIRESLAGPAKPTVQQRVVDLGLPRGPDDPLMQTVIYRLAEGGGKVQFDFDAMIEAIEGNIEPVSWDIVGGGGLVDGLELHGVALLIVQNSPEVQGKVAKHLAEWKRANGK